MRGEIEALGPAAARDYLAAVRARTAAALAREGLGDGTICEMVLRHELQHAETMRQTMAIAGLLPAGELPSAIGRCRRRRTRSASGSSCPPGSFAIGAAREGFAYDNERPRHTVEHPAFQIARLPVSNASWMRFSEGGGYERREWWSDEGWAWKQEYDIVHHPQIAAGHAGRARLPRLLVRGRRLRQSARRAPAHRGRVGAGGDLGAAEDATGPEAARGGSGGCGSGPAARFHGYPGFRAYPYREYSEVFFGEDYRVLRGGSWATHPRVASPTFRNWDLPLRRQIFAGVRLPRGTC